MSRIIVTAVLLFMLLGACGGDAPQLTALREDPPADLSATAAGQHLTTLATESGSAPSGVDVPALIVVLTAQ